MSLRGLRVVDRSVGEAGQRLGSLLAEQGAEVVAQRADGLGDPVFDRSKAVVVDAGPWIAGAAVLIDDRPEVPADVGRVHVRLPPFPLDHPMAGCDREELAEAASAVHHPPIGPPRVPPVAIAAPVTALLGACGVVAALRAEARGEGPQQVDVAQLDAGLFAQELAVLLTHDAPRCWSPLQWAASPFVAAYPARRGWLYVHLGLPHHVQRFVRFLESDGLRRVADALRDTMRPATWNDPSCVATVGEAQRIRALLRELFARRTATDWERVLSEAGLCAVAVRTGGAWRDHGHPRGAGHVVELSDPRVGRRVLPGPLVRTPRTPVSRPRSFDAPAPWSARTPMARDGGGALPLEGLRVLDLSQVIAGPAAGRALAWLGADVLHLDNPRLTAEWAGAFHAMLQVGKRSQGVDLSTPAGRSTLTELLTSWRPDVVVHNLAGDAAQRLLPEAYAGVVVAVSAWGQSGPWAGRRGWEQTIQAACGVQLDYGGDRPELLPLAVHDLCTGLAAAFGALCALHGGEGGVVDASLAMTSLWLQDHLFRGVDRAPLGRRGPAAREVASDAVWERGPQGWALAASGWEVAYCTLGEALRERPSMWARATTPYGEISEVLPPLNLSSTPCRHLPPAPPLEGGTQPTRPPGWRRDLGWARRTVVWGLEVARTRAPWA